MKRILFLILLILPSISFAGDLNYLLDGITTPVKVDTTTPANTRAYPFSYYSVLGVKTELALDSSLLAMSAKLPATLGQKTMANSLAVAIASDQSTLNVNVGNFPATQPVSGTVTVVQPTGTNLHAVIDSSALPAGAATEATLSALNAKFGSLGQKTMAGSAPVVIASDQSAIPASQSGTWNINNISGTVSLPTGASTAANQATANSSLSTIATNTSKVPIATSGTGSCITNLTTTAQTFTAPANAVGYLIQYPSIATNTDNVRFFSGVTATISTGIRLEPGRSEYVPLGASVSVIAETASSQTVCIQWIAQ